MNGSPKTGASFSLGAIDWRPPQMTPELSVLIDSAREGRRRLEAAFLDMGAQKTDAFVKTLILGSGGDACEPPLAPSMQTKELCESCLCATGPFDQPRVHERRMLRERARIYLHLTRGPFPLRDGADLLALWDEATRREPIIREFVDEPRWRTDADGLPFTGTKFAAIFGTRPLDPGNKTAYPADIPLLVDEIVSLSAREDLPPELVACGIPYLVFRIHPFKDGNGHAIRMLTCSLMHAAGYHEAMLLAYIDLLRERHNGMCDLSREVTLGKAQTEDHAIFHMRTIVDAQRSVFEKIDGNRPPTADSFF